MKNSTDKMKRKPRLTFDSYQKQSGRTAIYPGIGTSEGLDYCIFGLASEVGELCGKWKKVKRDDKGVLYTDVRCAMSAEVGDCLWYLQQICTELDKKLEEVAYYNLNKLSARKENGTLSGSGDER